MKTILKNGKLYDPVKDEYHIGSVVFDESGIWNVTKDPDETDACLIDASSYYIMPGLFDVHTHGCAGSDFTSAGQKDLERMSSFYLSHGVTSVMPTLASAPTEEWDRAIDTIRDSGIPTWKGIHFEGRYLNPQKRGAHALHLLAPLDPDELSPLCKRVLGAVHITAALELDDENHDFLKKARELGATVALGHTMATYAQAMDIFEAGAGAVTHLFNAMPPLHHREGGAVAAALLAPVYCELIADGLHVSPEMVRLAYRMKGEQLVLITDSMEGTGCPDGTFSIAGNEVRLVNGEARTPDGALAGSTLTLDMAVFNLMKMTGCSLGRAFTCASYVPAMEVGLSDRIGRILPGYPADFNLVGFDGYQYRIVKTIQNGKEI